MFDGKKLKQLREEMKLTQAELGRYFNITDASITHYEKGNRQPDAELIPKLAEFFSVSTDYLLGLTEFRTAADRVAHAIDSDKELIEFWQELRERPDLQLLFKQTKDMSDKDIRQIIKIIKAIEDEEDREEV